MYWTFDIKNQMEELNPFTEDWELFGFEGEPSPGFDYSWIQVQENISFIGYKSVISIFLSFVIKTLFGLMKFGKM